MRCNGCGNENPPASQFCGYCGQALPAEPAAGLPGAAAPRPPSSPPPAANTQPLAPVNNAAASFGAVQLPNVVPPMTAPAQPYMATQPLGYQAVPYNGPAPVSIPAGSPNADAGSVKDKLVLSIVLCVLNLFTLNLLGLASAIAAAFFSSRARKNQRAGDSSGASSSQQTAWIFIWVSIALLVVGIISTAIGGYWFFTHYRIEF